LKRYGNLDSLNSQHSTFNASGPNRGFVPDFRKARLFVINQLGGFVFEKLSALSHQEGSQTVESSRSNSQEQAGHPNFLDL